MENSLKNVVDNRSENFGDKNMAIVDNILILILTLVFLIFSLTFPHTYPHRLWITGDTLEFVPYICEVF